MYLNTHTRNFIGHLRFLHQLRLQLKETTWPVVPRNRLTSYKDCPISFHKVLVLRIVGYDKVHHQPVKPTNHCHIVHVMFKPSINGWTHSSSGNTYIPYIDTYMHAYMHTDRHTDIHTGIEGVSVWRQGAKPKERERERRTNIHTDIRYRHTYRHGCIDI